VIYNCHSGEFSSILVQIDNPTLQGCNAVSLTSYDSHSLSVLFALDSCGEESGGGDGDGDGNKNTIIIAVVVSVVGLFIVIIIMGSIIGVILWQIKRWKRDLTVSSVVSI